MGLPPKIAALLPRRLRTRILVGFLSLLGTALLTGVTGLWALSMSRHSEQAVTQSREALSDLRVLVAGANDAADSVHGYLLSGEARYLEGFEGGTRAFHAQLHRLELLEADNPVQSRRLARMSASFSAWEHAVGPLGHGALTPLTGANLGVDPGESQMAALRSAAGAFETDERGTLEARERQTAFASRSGEIILVLGPALAALAALALAGWLSSRVGGATQAVAEAAAALARGELAHRAVVGGTDELADAARAFNAMADQLEARSHQHELFTQMGKLLQACATFDEARRVVRQTVPALFPFESGALFMQLGADGFEPVATWGERQEVAGNLEVDDCWALRGVGTHWVKDPLHDVRCSHLDDLPDRESLCLPLLAQGERVGALCLVANTPAVAGQPPHFNLERRRAAQLVTEYVALATVNLRLREALKLQAVRDPLTSLFNRRYLEESLPRELSWARRHHRPLSVIFCDVDHFKRFNDTHGHDAGDFLLREMGKQLRSVFRDEDIVCRYGGEEFVILLRDCSMDDSVRRAENLRERCRAMRLTYQGKSLGEVTLSLGVSSYPEHGEEPAELLRAADQALFRAKGLGRNQVVMAREMDRSRADDAVAVEPKPALVAPSRNRAAG